MIGSCARFEGRTSGVPWWSHVGHEREEELRMVPTDGLLMWQEGVAI